MFIEDPYTFDTTVGILADLENTLGLDIAVSLAGIILSDKVQELLEFCSENPEYHIVSEINGLYVNRYIENAFAYFVANGNPNPCLKHQSPVHRMLEFYIED